MLSTSEQVSLSRKRILVAEDDDDLRGLLKELLSAEGYQVVELEDGYELEDYLEMSNGSVGRRLQPDLILTDMRMPGRSGLDVVREARQCGLTCPCILMSAFIDDRLRQEALRYGATYVLSKPFELDDVVALIARLAAH